MFFLAAAPFRSEFGTLKAAHMLDLPAPRGSPRGAGGQLRIGRHFNLGEIAVIENCFGISAISGTIAIGDDVGIGAFSFISCPRQFRIGNHCIIEQYYSIHAQNHIFEGEGLIRLQGKTEKGVE